MMNEEAIIKLIATEEKTDEVPEDTLELTIRLMVTKAKLTEAENTIRELNEEIRDLRTYIKILEKRK